MPGPDGISATAVRTAAIAHSSTTLRVASRPGQVRSPYRNAPTPAAADMPSSSGPAQPTPMPRCSRSAGRTNSARASRDSPAAPVTYTGQAPASTRSLGVPPVCSSACHPSGSSHSPATEAAIKAAASTSGMPGATPSARPVTAAGDTAQMPEVSMDSTDRACAAAWPGTSEVSRARSPPEAAEGAAPARNANAARSTGCTPGNVPRHAKPAAPAASPAARCGRARRGSRRMPRTGAPRISPMT